MASAQKYIIGNWKMYLSREESLELAAQLENLSIPATMKVAVCPDFVMIEEVGKKLTQFSLGAQDVSAHAMGAHTSEVNTETLKNTGVSHVILGHSEKRAAGEENEVIHEKLKKEYLTKNLIT
jgi:triosephosphate isomerase